MVWNVTPALHTPLMAVTNAVSGIIIVGAMLAAGPEASGAGSILQSIGTGARPPEDGYWHHPRTRCGDAGCSDVFGGFLVTQRMLDMFKKKGK